MAEQASQTIGKGSPLTMSTLNYTQYGLAPLFDIGLEDGVVPLRFNVILEAQNGWV